MRLGDIGRPVPGIGRVDMCPGFLRTFPFPQYAHDILSDVYADGTAESVVIEGDLAIVVHVGNIAGIIRCVTDISAATVTGNIFHYIWIRGGELVRLLYGHGRGLNLRGHVIH